MTFRLLSVSVFIVCLFAQNISVAAVYKYKDENGKWRWSDKPPLNHQQTDETELPTQKSKKQSTDIKALLFKKYNPDTPIAKATMSVVLSDTPLSKGSGFFVSENGYLITNKHVVRPSDFKSSKDIERQFESDKKILKNNERVLARDGSKLKKMKKSLKEYKQDLGRETNKSKKSMAQSEYDIYLGRYKDLKKEYDEDRKAVKKMNRSYKKRKSEYRWRNNLMKATNTFTIILKNDTKLKAHLVAVSKKYDLALLQLKGYTTPHLEVANLDSIPQGLKVYAIGNPLGLKDYVTSGIITRVQKKYIITDTQILPGNSGGPLVTKEGRILGVNTLKMSKEGVNSEGFGMAIPIQTAFDEFKSHIK